MSKEEYELVAKAEVKAILEAKQIACINKWKLVKGAYSFKFSVAIGKSLNKSLNNE